MLFPGSPVRIVSGNINLASSYAYSYSRERIQRVSAVGSGDRPQADAPQSDTLALSQAPTAEQFLDSPDGGLTRILEQAAKVRTTQAAQSAQDVDPDLQQIGRAHV